MVDAKHVMELRSMTGAGVVDAKKALEEAQGDIQKAIEILKRTGAVKAAKKTSERTTAEGVVASYIHLTKKLGAMVELQCETDFVARTDEFLSLANDIAMHVAAIHPLYLSPETISATEVEKQRELFLAELAEEKKPQEIKDKIIEGKMNKWYAEVCLVKQSFFRDEDKTIEALINEKIATIGEKIMIARFARFEMSSAPATC
jgi:elongation factor Ts